MYILIPVFWVLLWHCGVQRLYFVFVALLRCGLGCVGFVVVLPLRCDHGVCR